MLTSKATGKCAKTSRHNSVRCGVTLIFSPVKTFSRNSGHARRNRQLSVFPQARQRRAHGATGQRIAEARYGHDCDLVLMLARESHHVLLFRAGGMHRLVMAGMKQFTPVAAQAQRLHGCPHLDAAVLIVLQQFSAQGRKIAGFSFAVEFSQQLLAQRVIHRTTVIRIDQAEVPELCTLINIRIAGRSEHQHALRQRIDGAEEIYGRHESRHLFQKCVWPRRRSRSRIFSMNCRNAST